MVQGRVQNLAWILDRKTVEAARSGVRRGAIALAVGILVVGSLSAPARADHAYTVREGDTLSAIAQRFRTTVAAVRSANRLRSDQLRPGQDLDIPERGVRYVRDGDTLSRIARRHNVSVQALARTNRLRPNATLQVGQRLLLPGSETSQQRTAAEERWGRARRPGFANIVRLQNGRRVRMTLVDRRGRVRPAAVRRLSALMLSHRGRRSRVRRPHRRLIALLARVSDHFGGREIILISGFRAPGGYTRATSKHTQGRAVDFRVRGVPNSVLRDYCKTFSQVGVGYYPRSTFVHLDVRDRSAYWVDWSRPGEAPQYQNRQEPSDAQDSVELERLPPPIQTGLDDGGGQPTTAINTRKQ